MNRCIPVALALALLMALSGCEREARRFTTPAANSASQPQAPRTSPLQPAAPQYGAVSTAASNDSPYEANAYAVTQGKRLYRWYNCNGCHSMGGGGIGPPLMDNQWKYGSEPSQVFATIMQGRPQGMPSFGGHIPEDQVWQIVAYVRSMSGQLRKDVAPSRGDTLSPGESENARPRESPRPQTPPAPRPSNVPGER